MSAVTLQGRKPVEELGFTLAHEHMKIDFGGMFFHAPGSNIPSEKLMKDMSIPDTYFVRQYPYHFKDNLRFSDDDAVLESLKEYKRLGGGTVVEVSTVGLQRDVERCAKLGEKSGLNVIMGTGYYVNSMQKEQTRKFTVEIMQTFMSDELLNGFHGFEGKYYPGIVGEMGVTDPIADWEVNHLRAAGGLHEVEGIKNVPITIHPGRAPESPFEIMRILTEAGARPERVIIGHMDRTIHKYDDLVKLADEWKCYIQYDLFGVETSHYQMAKCFYPSDGERLNRLKHLMDNGFEDKLLIGHDIHTKHRLEKYGGHGYAHILRVVKDDALKTVGMSEEQWNKLGVINPQKILQF